MKFKRLAIFFYPLAFILSSCFAFNKSSNPDYVEIPFSLENQRVVVEATVNSRKGRFIFDTGSTESYLDIRVENLSRAGYTTTSYEGQQETVPYYNLKRITFGDVELKTNSWVLNHSDFLRTSQRNGYDGFFGAGVFEGYWCELSFSKSKIILHKEKPGYFTDFYPVKILSKYIAYFLVPVIIDGETFNFIIDTGAPYGIYYPDGIIRMKEPLKYQEIISADTEASPQHFVKTNSITILDETYTDLSVLTNSPYSDKTDGRGLLGIDFLKYYDFLFDYRDLRKGQAAGFYLEPNTSLEERDYGIYSFIKGEPQNGVLTVSNGEMGFTLNRINKRQYGIRYFQSAP